jgi:hypothetical protein
MKMQIFVMPARMAGIQVREDASGKHLCQPRFQHSMLERRNRGLLELIEALLSLALSKETLYRYPANMLLIDLIKLRRKD